jgi:probable addiction module antidote protein
MTRKYKNSVPFDEIMDKFLSNEENIKEYLNVALEDFIEDNNFNAFYKQLERVIKARGNISEFCEKIDINRSNLYDIFNNKSNPRLDTIAKILKELGYTLKIA